MSTTYVYIAAEDEFSEPVKVGISSNPIRRIRSLNTAWIGPKKLRPIYFVACRNREIALCIERIVLDRLKKDGVRISQQEIAWTTPDKAVGFLQLTWQRINQKAFLQVQYDLFGEAA